MPDHFVHFMFLTNVLQSVFILKYLYILTLYSVFYHFYINSPWGALIFVLSCWLFFFFLVLPVYCYQPVTLHPHAHMLSHVTPCTAARQAPLSMEFFQARILEWVAISFSSNSLTSQFGLVSAWANLLSLILFALFPFLFCFAFGRATEHGGS